MRYPRGAGVGVAVEPGLEALPFGKGEVRRIKIDPSLLDPGEVEVLEDLIVAALNDARSKAETSAAEQMRELAGGLELPPGMKLPF